MIKWNEVTWYSRLGALILFLGVVPTLSFYIGMQYELTLTTQQKGQAILDAQSQERNIFVSSATSTVVLFDTSLYSKDGTNFDNGTYKNQTTGDVISFKLLTDLAHQAPNPTYEAFLNGRSIGEVGGLIISMADFSPDNKYFIFRSQYVCGAGCNDFGLTVIDMTQSKIINLALPARKESDAFNKLNNYAYFDTFPFVDSYSWESNGDLDVAQYGVGFGKDGKYYQITPKEMWQYDLTTNQPTKLLETSSK